MPLINEAADIFGIDKSESLVLSSIEADSEIMGGGFTLQEPSGIPVSFTTSKEAGHHIMMNNQDMGMPYQKFSSMMQNQRLDHKETIQALKQKSKDEFEG